MYCSRCGEEVKENTYCTKCGTYWKEGSSQPINVNIHNNPPAKQGDSPLLYVLLALAISIAIPPIGSIISIIIGIIIKSDKPKSGIAMIIVGILPVILIILVFLIWIIFFMWMIAAFNIESFLN